LHASERLDAVFGETIALHERVRRGDPQPIVLAAAAIVAALRSGGKLLVCGNGGSAADAQHAAAELVGRFQRERTALAAIALTTDTSVLTSIANDYAFDKVFARQIEALGKAGDVVLGISASGGSANVVAALAAARRLGLRTIALTGCDGGEVGRAAEIHVNVPSPSTARVQEVHRTLLHAICELVEDAFVEKTHA
jgi:phosphoheptose isomerase